MEETRFDKFIAKWGVLYIGITTFIFLCVGIYLGIKSYNEKTTMFFGWLFFVVTLVCPIYSFFKLKTFIDESGDLKSEECVKALQGLHLGMSVFFIVSLLCVFIPYKNTSLVAFILVLFAGPSAFFTNMLLGQADRIKEDNRIKRD